MTLEEAITLVLEEGMMTEPVPDNAMAMLLHSGTEPDEQHLGQLMQALRIVSQGLKGQILLNRKLASALWVLGVEASTYLGLESKRIKPAEEAASANVDGLADLMTAVESVFLDDWFVDDGNGSGISNGTAMLEKQDVEKPETVGGETGPVLYHWTVDALYRALDSGVFEHPERLELIQGRIIENMSQGPRHSTLASEVADMLREAIRQKYAIREEKPVRIAFVAFDGEPIPDVMVLKGQQADYSERQPVPEDVELLVEVSDTTVAYDLGEKAQLYAQAGITDYWVVQVNEAAIVRHREPTPEGYREVMRLAGADTLSPLAMPEAVWTISALLGTQE